MTTTTTTATTFKYYNWRVICRRSKVSRKSRCAASHLPLDAVHVLRVHARVRVGACARARYLCVSGTANPACAAVCRTPRLCRCAPQTPPAPLRAANPACTACTTNPPVPLCAANCACAAVRCESASEPVCVCARLLPVRGEECEPS